MCFYNLIHEWVSSVISLVNFRVRPSIFLYWNSYDLFICKLYLNRCHKATFHGVNNHNSFSFLHSFLVFLFLVTYAGEVFGVLSLRKQVFGCNYDEFCHTLRICCGCGSCSCNTKNVWNGPKKTFCASFVWKRKLLLFKSMMIM